MSRKRTRYDDISGALSPCMLDHFENFYNNLHFYQVSPFWYERKEGADTKYLVFRKRRNTEPVFIGVVTLYWTVGDDGSKIWCYQSASQTGNTIVNAKSKRKFRTRKEAVMAMRFPHVRK